MDAVQWVALVTFLAAAASAVTWAVTRLRMERRLARQDAQLHEALATLEAERRAFRENSKAIEESSRRQAMDDFLADMRVEERHYIREHNLLFARRRSLVMQERIYFRNIPLSNWVEHEVPLNEGANAEDVVRTLSVFDKALELETGKGQRERKLLFG
jgi:hypothetical protein